MSTFQNEPTHQQGKQESALFTNRSDATRPVSDRSRIVSRQAGDIICGRGVHISCHNGNMNLHQTVNKYREIYLSGRRADKAKLVKLVLGEIKSTGARFIREVDDGSDADEWEEVDDETAYKKISHALRLRTDKESHSEHGTNAVGSRKLHRKRGANAAGVQNQLQLSGSTTLLSTTVPSANNNVLHPQAAQLPATTPPVPSVFNINQSAQIQVPLIGSGPTVWEGAWAEGLLRNATGQHPPRVFPLPSSPQGPFVAVPWWALQQTTLQPPIHNDAIQQLYTFCQHAIIGAMMQQSGQYPYR